MSVEDMTQQEWDEHHKQLEKYLDGVEKRHIAKLGEAMGFRREWVGLTDEDIDEASESRTGCEKYAWVERVIRNTEAILKNKNNA
jgi:hypothetical protein